MATVAESPATLVAISSDSEEEREKCVKNEKNSGQKTRNRKRWGTKGRGNSKKIARRRYSDVEIWTADEKELYDDECCILPSDPAGEIELKNPISDPMKDDVSVLAERGKVTCRDYPHARHSCAKYPFSETSHEDCCSQCFCYVCDVSAPCSYWKGPDGHCHASSHDKKWSAKRKRLRLSKKWMSDLLSTQIGQ